MLRNTYDFSKCIKCGNDREENSYTLSYLELQQIGCNKGKPFATLPVCDSCYYEYYDYLKKKRYKKE